MGNKEILDAEPWAVSNALDIAAKDTLSAKDEPILIFYNLGHLSIPQENRVLREKLDTNGHLVTIR